MLTYKRKPNSGKMHLMGRKGGAKNRASSHKILRPGDEMSVPIVNQLPGYPDSMDGWELIGGEPEAVEVEPKQSRPRSYTAAKNIRQRSKP
jgi:aspartate/methionine/tyrosine aminotransferase